MDPLSITAAALAFVTAISTVTKLVQDFKHAEKAKREWIQDLDDLKRFFEVSLPERAEKASQSNLAPFNQGLIQAMTLKDSMPERVKRLTIDDYHPDFLFGRLATRIKALADRLTPKTGRFRKVSQRLEYPFIKSDIERDFVHIRALKSDLIDFTLLDHQGLSEAILETQITKIRKENQRDVLDWLSPLKFLQRQDDVFNQCFHDGQTSPGNWLLTSHEFLAWRHGRPWLLYCYGEPGAGKTVTSSIVINHLEGHCQSLKDPSRATVLYLYLDHKERELQTLSNLLGSLLKQLVQRQHLNGLSKDVEAFRERSMMEKRPSRAEIVRIIKSELQSFERVYIVVDGLDECEEQTASELLLDLQSLDVSKVSRLITSRPIEGIFHQNSVTCNGCCTTNLTIYRSCTICDDSDLCEDCICKGMTCSQDRDHEFRELTEVSMKIRAPDDEIKRYVEWNLRWQLDSGIRNEDAKRFGNGIIGATTLGKHLRKDPTLMEKIPKTVTAKADGMFLLAQLYLKSLRMQPTVQDVLDTLEDLSTEIGEIYSGILKLIEENESPPKAALAKRALAFVVLARRVLTVAELLQALAIKTTDKALNPAAQPDLSVISSVTKSLLKAESDQGEVRLVHRTAQEYFESNCQVLFPGEQLDFSLAIMTYLNFSAFSMPCTGIQEDLAVDARLEQFAFLAYASFYWGEHVQKVADDPNIQAILRKFLNDPLRLESVSQAAWQVGSKGKTSTSWNARKGINVLHVCAFYGLDSVLKTLMEEMPLLDINSRDSELGETPLMYACKRGHVKTVSKLISFGADVNIRSLRGSTAVFESIFTNNASALEVLLKAENISPDVDVNATFPAEGGHTALQLAAVKGMEDAVKYLIARDGVLVNIRDPEGYTALALAAYKGEAKILEALLMNKGVREDINARNRTGASPLILAAQSGYLEAVDLLLQYGGDIRLCDDDDETAMSWAVTAGSAPVVRSILNHCPDVKEYDRRSNSLLHHACSIENTPSEIISLLILAGLDPNVRGFLGKTPLHEASRIGNLEIARVLLSSGAKKTITDAIGRTPFDVAWQNGETEMVNFLADSDVDGGSTNRRQLPDESDLPLWSFAKQGKSDQLRAAMREPNCDLAVQDPDNQYTALHWSVFKFDFGITKMLLDAGISPNEPAEDSQTPLHIAACQGDPALIRLLLEAGADAELKERKGSTALSDAQCRSNYSAAVELLKGGASIKTGKAYRLQPTFLEAVRQGCPEVVRILLENGADVHGRDSEGRTILEVAKGSVSPEVVELLRKRIYESPLPMIENTEFQRDKVKPKPRLEVALRDGMEGGKVVLKSPTWPDTMPHLPSPPNTPLLPVAKGQKSLVKLRAFQST